MTTQQSKARHGRSLGRWKILFAAVFAVYLSGGMAFGYVFVKQLESFFAIDLLRGAPALFSVLPPSLGIGRFAQPQPVNGRVTVLLLGIDQRESQRRRGEPARTDTMLLATIEPSTNMAGLLSIPRDLWVPIPGVGANAGSSQVIDRINTAYFWGEAYKYSGGGPGLAKRTVEYNLGVKVHYFASINFQGFQKAVDVLGGVSVDVPKPIYDEEYPDDDDGVTTISFRPGRQQMNGVRALQYVRTRHGDNDFGRADRQRQMLMALREKAMQLDALPRIPSLISILGESLQTDMSPGEMLRLGGILRSIDSSQMQVKAIDVSMTTPTVTTGGAEVLLPDRRAISKVIGEMFFDPNIKRENAAIEILNGTNKPGLASNVADVLTARGFDVTRIDNADRNDYRETVVKYYHEKPYSVRSLSDVLSVPPSKITPIAGADREADVTIILGQNAKVP